jgi:hypothetical protein
MGRQGRRGAFLILYISLISLAPLVCNCEMSAVQLAFRNPSGLFFNCFLIERLYLREGKW